MPQKISIHNFGPINEFEFELNDFNVLTGPQASGKSTVAKLVYYCKTIKNDLFLMAAQSQKNVLEVGFFAAFTRRLRWKFLNMFGDTENMSPDLNVTYEYGDDIRFIISLERSTKYEDKYFVRFDFSDRLQFFIRSVADRCERHEIYDLVEIRREITDFFDDDYECIYIPAGRSMITLLTDQINYIFSSVEGPEAINIDYCTRSYVERILKIRPALLKGLEGLFDAKVNYPEKENRDVVDKMIAYANKVLKGKYFFQSGEEMLQISDGRYIKINYASSGQQEAVWIFSIMVYCMVNIKRVFLVLEEPEAHLYPLAQQIISNAIGFFANQGHCVLTTTHSPYILGEFNNMLYASKIIRQPERRDEILCSGCILKPQKTAAYHMDNGDIRNAMEDGLILNELIDGASASINEENDALMRLYWEESER